MTYDRSILEGNRGNSILAAVVDYVDLSGHKLTGNLRKSAEAATRAIIEAREAGLAAKAAEEALEDETRHGRRNAVAVIVKQYEKGEDFVVPEDLVPELQAEHEDAARKSDLAQAAKKVAIDLFISELKRSGVKGLKMAETWREIALFEPSDSIRANTEFYTFADVSLALLKTLVLAIDGTGTKDDRRLRSMLDERPLRPELPRMDDVLAEVRSERRNSPLAKAQRAYDAGQAEEKENWEAMAKFYQTDEARAKASEAQKEAATAAS